MDEWMTSRQSQKRLNICVTKEKYSLHPREKKSVFHMDTSSTRHHGELEVITDLMTE